MHMRDKKTETSKVWCGVRILNEGAKVTRRMMKGRAKPFVPLLFKAKYALIYGPKEPQCFLGVNPMLFIQQNYCY